MQVLFVHSHYFSHMNAIIMLCTVLYHEYEINIYIYKVAVQ